MALIKKKKKKVMQQADLYLTKTELQELAKLSDCSEKSLKLGLEQSLFVRQNTQSLCGEISLPDKKA